MVAVGARLAVVSSTVARACPALRSQRVQGEAIAKSATPQTTKEKRHD
jgi:hypothetical protein